MNLIRNIIKYGLSTAIIFFLVKAVAENKLDDRQISVLVLLIMSLVILMGMNDPSCAPCPSYPRREHYQITDKPTVSSERPTIPNKQITDDKPDVSTDSDLNDLKQLLRLDQKAINLLRDNEKQVIQRLINKYRDEIVSTNSFNTIPLGAQLYGYTYLTPENWFGAYEAPPVCVTENKCPVCPIGDASVSGLMEFNAPNNVVGSTNVSSPTKMNIKYILQRLAKSN